MPWLVSDIFNWLAGLSGFYLLLFSELPHKERENPTEGRLVRIGLTYVAIALLSLRGLVWLVERYIHI